MHCPLISRCIFSDKPSPVCLHPQDRAICAGPWPGKGDVDSADLTESNHIKGCCHRSAEPEAQLLYDNVVTSCPDGRPEWKSVRIVCSGLIGKTHERKHLHTYMYGKGTHRKWSSTHFEKEIQSSLHLSPLICAISPPVSPALGDDKSTGLTRGPGCSSYYTTPGCQWHPGGGNENLSHCWNGTNR